LVEKEGVPSSPRLDSSIVHARLVAKTGKTGVTYLKRNSPRSMRRYPATVLVVGPLRQNRQNTQNLRPTSRSCCFRPSAIPVDWLL
jgi:hypothetical protein